MLFRTTAQIRKIMAPLFEDFGISTAQWVVLRILYDREQATREPLRLVELSSCLAIRQPSLTTLINKLVLGELIERVVPAGGGRGRQVRLMPKGRRLLERIHAPHRERERVLLSAWDAEEKRQALALLQKLWTQLEVTNRAANNGHEPGRPSLRKEVD